MNGIDEEDRRSYVVILRTVASMHTSQGDKDYYLNLAETLERGEDVMNLKEIITRADQILLGFIEGTEHESR